MAFDVRLTTAQGLVIAELAAKLDGAKRAQDILGINGHETRVLWNAARRIAAALPKTPASRRRSRFIWDGSPGEIIPVEQPRTRGEKR